MTKNQFGMGHAKREHWPYGGDGWFPYNGDIEEFRIWHVARTPEEIKSTMFEVLKGDEPGLAACYDFEDEEGQIVHDLSTHENHAILGKTSEKDESDPSWHVALIQDKKGQKLDGEYKGSFPTGDGEPGGYFEAGFLLDLGIQVTSPDKGHDWLWGEVQKITWLAPRVRKVRIEYSVDNGKNWSSLAEATPNDGEYVWEVPALESDAFRIRITDLDNPANSVVSQYPITVKPGRITVISPNGGEEWSDGQLQMIKWESEGAAGNVKLEVSYDNGENWSVLSESAENPGDYHWQLPRINADECLIRITDQIDPQISDISDHPFSIYREAANPRSDVNGDGKIDEQDLEIIKKDLGARVTSIPSEVKINPEIHIGP